jgi:hypothetical protein
LIEEGLKDAALLLAVVSPSYIKSNWCTRERQGFIEKRGGETRETIERVVKGVCHVGGFYLSIAPTWPSAGRVLSTA